MAKPPKPELCTTLIHQPDPVRKRAGRAVNPAVERASTLVFDKAADLYDESLQTYGLEGMAVHAALKQALMQVETGTSAPSGCTLAPSGLAACTLVLLAFCKAGDHVLVADAVYGPTRRFCDQILAGFGVTTDYLPMSATDLGPYLKPNTRLVFLESPGSLTMEVQDVPALVAQAKAANITTVIDNTYAAGVFFKPFDLGIDISIQAATKYQAGHADAFMGAVLSRTDALARTIERTSKFLGLGASAEDAALTLRGLRTMPLRLARHETSGFQVARWLAEHPKIARVLHPGLPSHPDHALWQRDFTGAAGLFSFELAPMPTPAVNAFLESLRLFQMGFSWGGYESLIIHCNPQLKRITGPATADRPPLLRVSVGLEDPHDLIADLDRGLVRLG